MRNTLCVVLGGGRGTRLFPLTKMRSKPAVPLAGKYRLIDIPISNCLNSGLNQIFILTQFNSESLNRHINKTYRLDAFSRGFVEILAAEQSMENTDWFQGTCDAVRQCLKHFTDENTKDILVLSGDHLYTADFRQMLQAKQQTKSDILVACKPMPISMAHHFGNMQVEDENKIVSFHEKPKEKSVQESLSIDFNGEPHCLASMGIYLFSKDTLVDLLAQNSQMTDFGKELIPAALGKYNVTTYNFDGYWADIGTIKSFYEANLLLTSAVPPLDLFNKDWRIFTRARFLPPSKINDSQIESSIIGDGCILESCKITSSVIGLRSYIGDGTHIESSFVMGADYYSFEECDSEITPSCSPRIGKNCFIKNAIIDKNVCIGDNVRIENKAQVSDYEDGYITIRDGITVVEKSAVIPDGFQI